MQRLLAKGSHWNRKMPQWRLEGKRKQFQMGMSSEDISSDWHTNIAKV
jgi:hypothetical protein